MDVAWPDSRASPTPPIFGALLLGSVQTRPGTSNCLRWARQMVLLCPLLTAGVGGRVGRTLYFLGASVYLQNRHRNVFIGFK